MKKNWFYLFALICSVALFTACSDDEGGNGGNPNPWVGTYELADYTAVPDYSWNESSVANWPTESALYAEWTCDDNYTEFLSALFRYLGGSILPETLNSITLQEDGNVVANYMASPTISLDPSAIMGVFLGAFPEVDASGFPTSGFVASPANLATWTESNGQLTVKLNINEILNETIGENPEMQELIAGILDMEPAQLKAVLSTLLGGADLSKLSDATIVQLQGWVKNGIPMHIETAENGHTYIYLDKSAFDNLFTADESGNSDIIILWGALSNAGIIPQEAQTAGLLLPMFNQYWPTTDTFNLGLDLIKK